jgi:hypothetical protein
VVASGQISPHFRGAKIDKFSDMQTIGIENFDIVHLVEKNAIKRP